MSILVVKIRLNGNEYVAHIDHAFNDESFVLFRLLSFGEIMELFKNDSKIIPNRIDPHLWTRFQARFMCLIAARFFGIIQYLIPELFPKPNFSFEIVKIVG